MENLTQKKLYWHRKNKKIEFEYSQIRVTLIKKKKRKKSQICDSFFLASRNDFDREGFSSTKLAVLANEL